MFFCIQRSGNLIVSLVDLVPLPRQKRCDRGHAEQRIRLQKYGGTA